MEALDYCIEQGIVVDGPALKCGVPHCILRGEPKYILDAEQIPEQNRTEDWMRVPACNACVLRSQCYGVRRLYVWMYGADEFKPVLEPGKLATSFATSSAGHVGPSRGPTMPSDVRPWVADVGRRMGLDDATVERALDSDRTIAFSLDGDSVGGWRARSPAGHTTTMGPVEISSTVDGPSCRTGALLQALHAAALGVPAGGAHGGIACDPRALDAEEIERLLREYVAALADAIGEGEVDHLTPHTSAPWAAVEAAVRAHRGARPTSAVSLLRRSENGSAGALPMTSVDSAVAAGLRALAAIPGDRPVVRYSVWGFGRAGRRFADLFDRVALAGRRPMLIACADSQSASIDPRGLEHERIIAFKTRTGRLPTGYGDRAGPDVLVEPADLLLLSGRGRPFDEETAARVAAKVVVDMTGALDAKLERALERAGCVVVPSIVATSGPVILADVERRGDAAGDAAAVRHEIARRTEQLLDATRTMGARHGLTSTEAVVALGLERMIAASR
jgi:glutamate dehydrogenase (NAD(P)+)